MNTVTLITTSGSHFSLRGYASWVSEAVNAARGGGKLIALELDRIPTGQMIHVDPDQVESIRDDHGF